MYLRMRQMRSEFRYAAVGVGDAGDEPGVVDEDMEPVTESSLVEGLAMPFEEERLKLRELVEDLGAGRRGDLVMGNVVKVAFGHAKDGQRTGACPGSRTVPERGLQDSGRTGQPEARWPTIAAVIASCGDRRFPYAIRLVGVAAPPWRSMTWKRGKGPKTMRNSWLHPAGLLFLLAILALASGCGGDDEGVNPPPEGTEPPAAAAESPAVAPRPTETPERMLSPAEPTGIPAQTGVTGTPPARPVQASPTPCPPSSG